MTPAWLEDNQHRLAHASGLAVLIGDVLNGYREWLTPRDGVGDNPFVLACRLADPANRDEIVGVWHGSDLPQALVELWLVTKEAWLFEDVDYGQWGLHLLSPDASLARTTVERGIRPKDIRIDDVVIGEFLGDQELLVLSPSEDGAGGVLIALPLDARSDWYIASVNLSKFLESYLQARGDKYWEATAAD